MVPRMLRRLKRFLGIQEVDEEAVRLAEEAERARVERLVRDPFAFASEEEWRAFRRRHGYRTWGRR